MRHLQRELLRAKEEIRRIQSVPLVIGQFNEMIDANYGIVSSTAGSNYYVRILSTLDRELLKPNTSIALHRHSHSVVDILPPESDSTVKLMAEKPNVSYKEIGGLDIQKQEVREAIELPLIQHHLYQQIGIDPPRGVLLYGPPGTGKTMMAKAVANATEATFISMVGSEFVQKYLGEGPRKCNKSVERCKLVCSRLLTHSSISQEWFEMSFVWLVKTRRVLSLLTRLMRLRPNDLMRRRVPIEKSNAFSSNS